MAAIFKVGDRVRVKPDSRHPNHRPGDTGIVVLILPSSTIGGDPLYIVRMDGEPSHLNATFYGDELELVT